ncbi:FtsW/RodA/SpoVE family cell cycle protein [Clostridium sp. BJN0013]|uniref:FtsW/RodA/SpoVE family cell cycle protein n=1 Tax=Clostridium sp. BJN0013 TaxID=3236840 RepID=UPI0034C604A2
MGIRDSKIDDYINKICSHVRCKQAHNEIREELLDHFQEKIKDMIADGMEEKEAIEKSILQMGDAEVIGKQLNESHKVAQEVWIILLTILLSLVGMLTIYFIATKNISSSTSIFYKNIIFNMLGYCIMVVLYFFNYSVIERYTKIIYIAITLTLILQLVIGSTVNGTKKWINLGVFRMDITELSLFLYAIALSKILEKLDWNNIKQAIYGFIMVFLPLVLYILLGTMICSITYLALFLALMILVKSKLKHILTIIGMVLVSSVYFIVLESYPVRRSIAILFPNKDIIGAGYFNFQIGRLLKIAGLYGQGFTFPTKILPEVQNDFVLTYIVYTFGWISGITVIGFAFIFIIRMFLASKKVKDSFGCLIIQGFMCIFLVKFTWNVLIILGFLPIMGVSFPFISFGGTASITQMAAVGLILSIYKRKNLRNISVNSIKS